MIYVDSSALSKLIWPERESSALAAFLDGRELVSSDLLVTELRRSAIRRAPVRSDAIRSALLSRADSICDEIELVPLDVDLLLAAGELAPPALRSLDAIHVASALTTDAECIVTYDRRQGDAALAVGLDVSAPGR